jgi:hypothetical protein
LEIDRLEEAEGIYGRTVRPGDALSDSESCPRVVFGISGFCYQSQIISKMDLKEIGCEDGRWMELAQDRVQWRALVLAVR